jgi:NAD(P)-dependent dehydrogenase (short-subunit alcohol dehydrogenase family)
VGDEDWNRAFRVNVIGSCYVADEAVRIWKEQGLAVSLALTASVNAVVAKRDSMAYETSEATADNFSGVGDSVGPACAREHCGPGDRD